VLEFLDRVFASRALSLQLEYLLLNSLVLEALGDKLAHEELLLFHQVSQLLVFIALLFGLLLNEFLGALYAVREL